MRPAGYPDSLVVINGPEDGTEFAIARTPVYVGRDPACVANVRLDASVGDIHSLLTVVSEGYRVRRMDSGATYVNGKRVGRVRSRILRSGDVLQVGDTLLTLECSPDGLASRSRGLVHESDFAWVLRYVGGGALRFLGRLAGWVAAPFVGLFRFVWGTLGRFVSSPLGIVAILILVYIFVPAVHDPVNRAIVNVYQKFIAEVVRQIIAE
jgi:hypothetical protein